MELQNKFETEKPLAERMRPRQLKDFVGQKHLLAETSVLAKMMAKGSLPSMILYGPCGSGKTTLAGLLGRASQLPFHQLSAVENGLKDLRALLVEKEDRLFSSSRQIIFIDEIHRFNKAQQDALLNHVEQGKIILIGATTENPSFQVNQALLSRCRVFILQQLSDDDIKNIVNRAIAEDGILKQQQIEVEQWESLLRFSDHDARKALNILEMVVSLNFPGEKILINNELVDSCIEKNFIGYDKKGDNHYDVISAFIKSIRGSDPNAAIYYLALMAEAHEEVGFIARRLVILASEDIGLANPTALVVANACFEAVTKIGWPEARIILAQCAIYLAGSPKSNSAYLAVNAALEHIKKNGAAAVPLKLRGSEAGWREKTEADGKYRYSHDYNEMSESHFAEQNFMPELVAKTVFYRPANNAREAEIAVKLKKLWSNFYDYS